MTQSLVRGLATSSHGPRPVPPGAVAASGPIGHPDRKTTWIIVMAVHLEPGAVPPPDLLAERLGTSVADFPLLASRLRSGWWIPASVPAVSVTAEQRPLDAAPLQPFNLGSEAPLRVLTSTRRDWLLLAAHHFAFDGLGMVSLLRALLYGIHEQAPDYTTMSAPRSSLAPALARLLRPADPVAPSDDPPAVESFACREVVTSGRGLTARLARASASAAMAHNASRGHSLRRIGVSVAVGGVGGEGATYRRLDVVAGDDIEAAVTKVLSSSAVPAELKGLPPGAFLLQPLMRRFSDTVLVSNLGRVDLPGVTGIEFYPVARGRSAVAVAAAGLGGGSIALTLRAKNLSPFDTNSLLSMIADDVTHGGSAA